MRLLHAQMLERLSTAQKERPKRKDDWIEFEQMTMLTAVNEERHKRGLLPTTIDEIRRIETAALGHVDYSEKFALYCTDLAEGYVHTR